MKIETNSEICNDLIYKFPAIYNPILGDFRIKKILNDYFNPDEYLFFTDDVSWLPLVVKGGVVYFYGGNLPLNEYSHVSETLFDSALKWLVAHDYEFVLTGICNDYYNQMSDCNKKYDVPYNQDWTMDLSTYDEDLLIQSQPKKKRGKLKRTIKSRSDYSFVTVSFDEFMAQWSDCVLSKMISSFGFRDKNNSWQTNSDLYELISVAMDNLFNCDIRLMFKSGNLCGFYFLVSSGSFSHVLFCNSFRMNDSNVTPLLYFDLLNRSKLFERSVVSAGRGSFSYKKKLGFSPVPLYCSTNHKSWNIHMNGDLSEEETVSLYGRKFGVLL